MKNEEAVENTLEIELTHTRWRHLVWAIVGLGAGLFLALRMGELGLILGVICGVYGLSAAHLFLRTLRHAPGTIVLRSGEVALPERLCSGNQVKVAISDVRHAYLLRRALPWNHHGPVLVVETNLGIFQYPRDWFDGENDQRRLFLAFNRRLGRLP